VVFDSPRLASGKYARGMRLFLVLVVSLACKQSKPAESTDPPPTGSATAVSPAEPPASGSADPSALTMDHVTLLQPEAVIEKRLSDQKGWATTIKAAAAVVTAYDKAQRGALPSDLDLVIVGRPGALRCWLSGEQGDVVASELDQAFAKLPKFGVREGNVGVVVRIVRPSANPPARGPASAFLPAALKQGGDIDAVIDAAWPRT
jgi:hypothetical protein